MISELIGIPSDYVIIGLVGVTVILLILYIVNIVQMSKLKKNYNTFMGGADAKSLEKILLERLDQIDGLVAANAENENHIKTLFQNMKFTFQKVGLVKYDAFDQMGGKLSSSIALLNETDDGFIINSVHGREGCYIYVKDIIAGNSVIILSEEEKQALEIAKNSNK